MRISLIILLIFITCNGFAQSEGFYKIKKLCSQTKYKEAIEQSTIELNQLNRKDSIYKKILQLQIDCYMELKDFESAIEDYKILISIDSTNVEYYASLSFAYYYNLDNENCLISIHKAYEINPNDIATLNNMSYYYGQAGKYIESIKFANAGLEQVNLRNTLKDALFTNRGYAFIGLKQYDKAMEDINQALSYNPNNSFPYFYRALINIELNKMDNVCQDLIKAKSLGGVNMTKDFLDKYCNE